MNLWYCKYESLRICKKISQKVLLMWIAIILFFYLKKIIENEKLGKIRGAIMAYVNSAKVWGRLIQVWTTEQPSRLKGHQHQQECGLAKIFLADCLNLLNTSILQVSSICLVRLGEPFSSLFHIKHRNFLESLGER